MKNGEHSTWCWMKGAFTAMAALLVGIPMGRGQQTLQVDLVPWAQNIGQPVKVTHAGDDRLFVALQWGAIYIIADSMVVLPTPFLDISGQVLAFGEQGLLGLAFDPDYANNGFFYVYYTTGTGNGTNRLSRFKVSSDPDLADPNSEVVMLSIPEPFTSHNGGQIEFGPDGHLYIGVGDGGSGGDPLNNAHDLSTPLGCILRIHPETDGTYTIPAGNPFRMAAPDTLPEIWAYGLRNPYRFGIDPATGDLWVGDVGQESYEELDLLNIADTTGPDLGWRCYEGNAPYNTLGCPDSSLMVFPISVHAHALLGGTWCAIIGGRAYHGSAFPHMQGRMFYTDYCSGTVRSVRTDGLGGWLDEEVSVSGSPGFSDVGEGSDGSLYISGQFQNKVYKLVDHCPQEPPTISTVGDTLFATTAATYQWYLNGQPLLEDTLQQLVMSVSGYYQVGVTFLNGCTFLSDTIFAGPVGMAEHMSVFAVVPNPARDEITIIASAPWGVGSRYHIVDLLGRVVQEGAVGDGYLRIRLEDRAPGMRWFIVQDGSGAVRGMARFQVVF